MKLGPGFALSRLRGARGQRWAQLRACRSLFGVRPESTRSLLHGSQSVSRGAFLLILLGRASNLIWLGGISRLTEGGRVSYVRTLFPLHVLNREGSCHRRLHWTEARGSPRAPSSCFGPVKLPVTFCSVTRQLPSRLETSGCGRKPGRSWGGRAAQLGSALAVPLSPPLSCNRAFDPLRPPSFCTSGLALLRRRNGFRGQDVVRRGPHPEQGTTSDLRGEQHRCQVAAGLPHPSG